MFVSELAVALLPWDKLEEEGATDVTPALTGGVAALEGFPAAGAVGIGPGGILENSGSDPRNEIVNTNRMPVQAITGQNTRRIPRRNDDCGLPGINGDLSELIRIITNDRSTVPPPNFEYIPCLAGKKTFRLFRN
jgi:hypothetical protein